MIAWTVSVVCYYYKLPFRFQIHLLMLRRILSTQYIHANAICHFVLTESGTMESMSANLDATDDLVPTLPQVNLNFSVQLIYNNRM